MKTNEVAAAAAPAKQKSPMLTALERVVYEHCIETGDTIEEGKYSAGLQAAITTAVWDQLREERIDEKLNLSAVWLRQQLAKERAGVRRPQDEPNQWVGPSSLEHADLKVCIVEGPFKDVVAGTLSPEQAIESARATCPVQD